MDLYHLDVQTQQRWEGMPFLRRLSTHRSKLMLLTGSLVFLTGGLALLLVGISIVGSGTVWAHIRQAPAPACVGQSCDNVDPDGRCTAVGAQGGCLAPSTFRQNPGLPATPTSCAQSGDVYIVPDRYFGVINVGALELEITTDGTSKGVALARVALMYSTACQTNWLLIAAVGPCISPTLTPICLAQGSLSRPASPDGPARSVFLIDPSLRPVDQSLAPGPNVSASNRSAMLYAPHTPVQGCVRISVAGVTSPLSCLTQPGFPTKAGTAKPRISPIGKEVIV